MILLALDTSGDTCSVAIANDADVLAETRFEHERRLVERLPAVIEATCAEAGVRSGDVDALAAGIGPGSFTGVRVAVATAKAWAWAANLSVVGIPGFEAMAEALGSARPIVGLAPCRRGEAIVWLGGSDYSVMPIESIVATARQAFGGGSMLAIGEAARWLPETPDWEVLPRGPWASEIATAAWRRLSAGGGTAPADIAPLYGAPPPIRGAVSP